MVIKIFDLEYKVEFADAADLGDKLGDIDANNQIIRVWNGASESLKRNIMLHEVLHGVLFSLGIEHSENLIDSLTTGLLSVFDNNQSFVSLMKPGE